MNNLNINKSSPNNFNDSNDVSTEFENNVASSISDFDRDVNTVDDDPFDNEIRNNFGIENKNNNSKSSTKLKLINNIRKDDMSEKINVETFNLVDEGTFDPLCTNLSHKTFLRKLKGHDMAKAGPSNNGKSSTNGYNNTSKTSKICHKQLNDTTKTRGTKQTNISFNRDNANVAKCINLTRHCVCQNKGTNRYSDGNQIWEVINQDILRGESKERCMYQSEEERYEDVRETSNRNHTENNSQNCMIDSIERSEAGQLLLLFILVYDEFDVIIFITL